MGNGLHVSLACMCLAHSFLSVAVWGPPLPGACMLNCFSRIQFFATLQTVATQSVHGIFLGKKMSVLPFPTPGDLPDPGIKLASPALVGRFFTFEPPGRPPTAWYLQDTCSSV